MSNDRSRREFLQAGLALPAVGLALISTAGSCAGGSSRDPTGRLPHAGKTGLKVSGVGYGIGYVPVPEVLERAIDMGINYFDTSRDYKDSEQIFSGVLKGKRDKIHISTKSGSIKKDDILKDLDTSLQTLGTDYVERLASARAGHTGTCPR